MIAHEDILNARILIVDDNQSNVSLLQKILLSAGYKQVLSTTDSREVKGLYRENHPDLILLDIKMPYLDGYQVMEQINEIEQDDCVPILVLTALKDRESRIRSLKSGAKDLLTKPFDHTETLIRIRNMLETRLLYSRVRNQNDILEQKVEVRTRELADANREIEDFVYLASHDLKEPLFSIGGFVAKLSIVYNDLLDGQGMRFLERIKDNTEKMNKKLHQIMDVLKAGKVEYKFRDNESGSIVEDVISGLQDKLSENKIKISYQDDLPKIHCDRERIKDVFTNLITNAIKFINDDEHDQNSGEIGNISIGYKKSGMFYKFFIEDSGIGIREEDQEQVFKMFTRLYEKDVEGSGVGLSIVKKVVERHNGKIWVESPVRNGKGSRFNFSIPIEWKVFFGDRA